MKRLLVLFTIILVSCNEKGEIKQEPTDFIKIHGKVYKLIKIVPAYNENAIWIMYPKDSTDAQPEVINYDIRQGKVNVNQTVIEVK